MSGAKLELHLEGEVHQIECTEDETVLDAALREGLDAPYSCLSGTCNTCQASLIEGTVEMDECDALTEDEVAAGEVLTCQSRPTSAFIKIKWPD